MRCFLLCFSLLCLLCPLSATQRFLHVYAPGDIIIGGLFPLHLQPNQTPSSTGQKSYDLQMFLGSQMMIFAINEINQGTPRALPDVTLGYDVYDTCGDVSLAMRMALDMSVDKSDPPGCFLPEGKRSSAPDPRVKVVIGERSSEVSVAVARILTLSSISQISYASTSELLSRKLKFPNFLRTVSSDAYQTKAIAELVGEFNWETVGIVGSDDEYGKYGSESLVDHFSAMANVCLNFKVILPSYFNVNDTKARRKLTELMDTIQNSTAEAIILFTKGSNVMLVFEAAIRMKLNRTWIASDSWSITISIRELPGIEVVGQVFGFTFKSHIVPGFADYVASMVNGNSSNLFWKYHLLNYPPCSKPMNCSLTGHKCMEKKCLIQYIEWNESFNIYLAVKVITHALRSLMKCDSKQCQRNTSFTAHELFDEIKNVNFTVNNTNLQFDENGDPSLGYNIIQWRLPKLETIGMYWPSRKIELCEHLVRKMRNVTVTAFSCHKTCSPGYELMTQGSKCCKQCVPCRDGHFSPHSGKPCEKCEDGEYSSLQQDQCFVKKNEFLQWKNPFIIALCFINILGIVATVLVVVLFVVNRSTPIVKAVGGYLCFLELFSLLTCFCLSFTFILKPTKASCMTGMPLFGIAFTLCVSCILANLLQILVGFNFAQNIGGWLKRLNHPPAVVAILFGVQLVLCSLWLAYYPPSPQSIPNEMTIILECDLGSKMILGAMLGYVALLAIICFLFAFNGKRLPDLYKNASFVTVGMLLFLVVWIVFIPVYIHRVGNYTRAIEAAAVIVSSYSMLCCHLVPKCYIMVCRKELNNQKAITDYIKKHYEQKGIDVLKS